MISNSSDTTTPSDAARQLMAFSSRLQEGQRELSEMSPDDIPITAVPSSERLGLFVQELATVVGDLPVDEHVSWNLFVTLIDRAIRSLGRPSAA
jgi:hypothetical protein